MTKQETVKTTDGGQSSAPQQLELVPSSSPRRSIAARLRVVAGSASLIRAVREIVVVTLGILIAFALNTWWEGRRDLREEQKHLRALVSDFERNKGQLEQLSKAEEKIASDSLKLLQLARRTDAVSQAIVRQLVNSVFSSKRFEPVMGAYEALVNSEGFTLVRNDELRASLARFAAEVSGQYGESFGDEMYIAFVREFSGKLQFSDWLMEAPLSPKAYTELLADPKF